MEIVGGGLYTAVDVSGCIIMMMLILFVIVKAILFPYPQIEPFSSYFPYLLQISLFR